MIVFRFCARIDTNAPSTKDSTKSSVARVMVLHASFAQFLTSLSSFMMRFTRASGSATSGSFASRSAFSASASSSTSPDSTAAAYAAAAFAFSSSARVLYA